METLITGGTGLVGRHLVPELQARGDRVRVLALPGEDTAWLERRGVATVCVCCFCGGGPLLGGGGGGWLPPAATSASRPR